MPFVPVTCVGLVLIAVRMYHRKKEIEPCTCSRIAGIEPCILPNTKCGDPLLVLVLVLVMALALVHVHVLLHVLALVLACVPAALVLAAHPTGMKQHG